MEKLGQEYRRRASPVQCHIPIPFRDRGMNLLNTTFLTSALIVKLREQALEPTRVPGGLHPYAHADSFFLQLAVELLSLPTAVCSPPLSALSSFSINPCN